MTKEKNSLENNITQLLWKKVSLIMILLSCVNNTSSLLFNKELNASKITVNGKLKSVFIKCHFSNKKLNNQFIWTAESEYHNNMKV